eukprot:SAG11_NODE_2577_length_3200_cov_30.456304_2_plen_147_part_00
MSRRCPSSYPDSTTILQNALKVTTTSRRCLNSYCPIQVYGRTADTAQSRKVQTLPELILPIPDARPYCRHRSKVTMSRCGLNSCCPFRVYNCNGDTAENHNVQTLPEFIPRLYNRCADSAQSHNNVQALPELIRPHSSVRPYCRHR